MSMQERDETINSYLEEKEKNYYLTYTEFIANRIKLYGFKLYDKSYKVNGKFRDPNERYATGVILEWDDIGKRYRYKFFNLFPDELLANFYVVYGTGFLMWFVDMLGVNVGTLAPVHVYKKEDKENFKQQKLMIHNTKFNHYQISDELEMVNYDLIINQ